MGDEDEIIRQCVEFDQPRTESISASQSVRDEIDTFQNVSLNVLHIHLELLFKSFMGFWYQHRSIMSNMNIFGSMMSVENMISRTAGGDDCSSPGDYIRQHNKDQDDTDNY